MSLYCSRKECNPMLPLFGTVKLVRKYWEDHKTGKCPKCKHVFHIKIMTDGKYKLLQKGMLCPYCHVELKPEKRWYYACPKCGTIY